MMMSVETEILKTIRELNRAFNHNAEAVFVNTITREIDDRHAPILKANRIDPKLIGRWIEKNYGYVHPAYPNLLFFAVDRFNGELFTCCPTLPPILTCTLCNGEIDVTPQSLAQHEWIHSLQLLLNPHIGHHLAENVADDFEELDIKDIIKLVDIGT